jgi:hypothetical protein
MTCECDSINAETFNDRENKEKKPVGRKGRGLFILIWQRSLKSLILSGINGVQVNLAQSNLPLIWQACKSPTPLLQSLKNNIV